MNHLIALTLFLACAANAYGGGFGQSLSNGGLMMQEGENYMQQKKLREYLDNCIQACSADGYCQAQCLNAYKQAAPPARSNVVPEYQYTPPVQPYAPPTQTVCRWVYGTLYCNQY